MLFDDSTPCWGRADAPICDACTRLHAPAEYAGDFPVMSLLVPSAHLRQEYRRGQAIGPQEWFCAERRSVGTHRPAAVCGAANAAVCAETYSVHHRTIGGDAAHGKPLGLGG